MIMYPNRNQYLRYLLLTNNGDPGWHVKATFDTFTECLQALTKVGEDYDYLIVEIKKVELRDD